MVGSTFGWLIFGSSWGRVRSGCSILVRLGTLAAACLATLRARALLAVGDGGGRGHYDRGVDPADGHEVPWSHGIPHAPLAWRSTGSGGGLVLRSWYGGAPRNGGPPEAEEGGGGGALGTGAPERGDGHLQGGRHHSDPFGRDPSVDRWRHFAGRPQAGQRPEGPRSGALVSPRGVFGRGQPALQTVCGHAGVRRRAFPVGRGGQWGA